MYFPRRSPDVYIDDTGTAKGRGVFAARDFAAGEIVEVCPVIIVKAGHKEVREALDIYVFDWGYLAVTTPCSAIALGYGTMYNHGNPANLTYKADKSAAVIVYRTVEPVMAKTEFTVNYKTLGGAPIGND